MSHGLWLRWRDRCERVTDPDWGFGGFTNLDLNCLQGHPLPYAPIGVIAKYVCKNAHVEVTKNQPLGMPLEEEDGRFNWLARFGMRLMYFDPGDGYSHGLSLKVSGLEVRLKI
jgi:hypothetical protein